MKKLSDFPRVDLAIKPTPLEPLANLNAVLPRCELWVKRDECTGLGLGGNKARQLEYYFGDARARGADTVIITGAVQSNFVCAAAAAAARLGMHCEIQLEERVEVAAHDIDYRRSGNVLLDRLFGATLHTYPDGDDEAGADAALETIADRARKRGREPYIIHLSEGHPPLGALGYVEAAAEILAQAQARDVAFDAVVVGSGSGATHAGLLVGLALAGRADLPVHGICVRREAAAQAARIRHVCAALCRLLETDNPIDDIDVRVHDDWLAPGYGRASEQVLTAIRVGARQAGLLLDPVYSGKSFAGALGLARRGVLPPGSRVLFVHTGGVPALFAYRATLEPALQR